jgi:molybdopterin synthase catalytic subunit
LLYNQNLVIGTTTAVTMVQTTVPTTVSNNDDLLWVQVSEELPSVQECYEYCAADTSCGAVSSFVGITRDNFQGKQVLRLSYEAYESMATKVLRDLCREAQDTYSVRRIVAVHKLGDCPVGKASVIIFVSSPHRQASLDATSFLINELKARVPIWKREVYEGDEDSVWKENIEWKEGKPKRVMVKEGESS